MSSTYRKIQKKIQKRLEASTSMFFIKTKNTNLFLHCVGTDLETDDVIYELYPSHIPAAIWKHKEGSEMIRRMNNPELELCPFNRVKNVKGSTDQVVYIRKRGTNLYAHFQGFDTKGEHNYSFLEGYRNSRMWHINIAKKHIEKVDVNANLEIVPLEDVLELNDNSNSN